MMKGCVLNRPRGTDDRECNVGRIARALRTDCETAYAVLLMTALLTDLSPDDPEAVAIVLKDNLAEDECCVAAS